MIVRQFDVFGVAFVPYKADSPLIVDTNTVLSRPIPNKGFKAVSRGNTQIKNRLRSMNHDKLPISNALYVRRNSLGVSPLPY
jgi:hypothetical protein